MGRIMICSAFRDPAKLGPGFGAGWDHGLMQRRAFLGMLGAAALDPERLLWTPGRKLISIPPHLSLHYLLGGCVTAPGKVMLWDRSSGNWEEMGTLKELIITPTNRWLYAAWETPEECRRLEALHGIPDLNLPITYRSKV